MKKIRHAKIIETIQKYDVETQEELANYLREATKLMKYRYRILEKEMPMTCEGLTEGEKNCGN